MTTRAHPRRTVGRALVGATAAALALAAVAAPGTAAASADRTAGGVTAAPTSQGQALGAGRYVVMFRDMPAASYTGGIPGYRATKPAPGERMRPSRAEVVKYRSYLRTKHDNALKQVGLSATAKIYDYSVAFNGVAVDLTAAQAKKLSKLPSVVRLFHNERSTPTTNVTPGFLGLTGPGGLWSQLGGAGRNGAGAGTVVGVIDTGIWPENPGVRFADTPKRRIPGWEGICQAGENFSQQQCNDKLIGARYFYDGVGKGNILPADYKSARDYDGHGTHTATTAAGSPTTAVVDGVNYGTVSGMAPAARLAVYKACWDNKAGDSGCWTADTTAAIDAAVADGVDAINFSIGGGSESTILSPDEIAFLFAADAGVFVAASAGNNGPGASTTDHVSPWLTSTAAATAKVNEKVVLLGNGARYVGASSTGTLPATPAVLSTAAGLAGADATQARLCYPGTLNPAVVTGKVVVCDRGVIARVDKSQAVAAAGGVGMVLANTSPNSLNADLHVIPTVHVNETDGAAIKAYVGGNPAATVAITTLNPGESTTQIPEIAEFSSRGPSVTTGGDILKPDIAAPGVDILAGISPVSDGGRNWDLLSGTSMASPHIAGIGALLSQAHPDWSPAEMKSALQTSAVDMATPTSPFAQGAGLVQPTPAAAVDLVYDAGFMDWLQFIQGQGLDVGVAPIDASDLNQATIAIGQLAGSQTVTRTVTNVSGGTVTYNASASVPGINVTVSPSSLTLAPGESKSFEVTFTSTNAATLGEYATGTLTWSNGSKSVRSAVAVRPVGVSAPIELSGTGASGSVTADVVSGFTGTMGTQVYGLTAGTATQESVAINSAAFDADAPAASAAVTAVPITVNASTSLLRVDVDAASDANDLDLYLYDSAGNLVALSATGASDEQVTVPGIAAGSYTAFIHGYGGPSPAAYTLTTYLVGSSDAGNLSVTPSSQAVTVAGDASFTFTWSGLGATTPYLGWVGYTRGSDTVGMTLVSVN